MRTSFTFATVMVLVPACGSGIGGDDPGTGTGTLFIDADADAEPQIPNAQRATDFNTDFEVRITRAGVDVTTGTVTIDSAGGELALVYSANDQRWRGTQNGYHEGYELNVVSAEDAVEGLVLNGPDFHSFTAPTAGVAIDASLPVEVRWDRSDRAQVADLDTRDTDRIAIEDTGRFTLPPLALRYSRDQVETDELDLRRWSRISPAGAVGGSEFRVEVRNRLDVLVAACPTCP